MVAGARCGRRHRPRMRAVARVRLRFRSPCPLAPRPSPRRQPVRADRWSQARILGRLLVSSTAGYAGTTNQIAEQAGLSVGSLYQYFPNKDSILVELIERHIADATRRFVAAGERFEPRARSRIGCGSSWRCWWRTATPLGCTRCCSRRHRPASTRTDLRRIETAAITFVRDDVMVDDDRPPAERELPSGSRWSPSNRSSTASSPPRRWPSSTSTGSRTRPCACSWRTYDRRPVDRGRISRGRPRPGRGRSPPPWITRLAPLM